jgi:DNA-directed RNA polymerase specialized sigma24 family protein
MDGAYSMPLRTRHHGSFPGNIIATVPSGIRYIYYRVGSHALAEDLTSETFLRALRGICWHGSDS